MAVLQQAKRALQLGQSILPAGSRLVDEAMQRFAGDASSSPTWVFLGPPGVGKGTYSTRVAQSLGVPHISAGDLVRQEIQQKTAFGVKMASYVDRGNLLPDSLVLEILQHRLEQGRMVGETGFLLDGFPRTRRQAEALTQFSDVQLAVNLSVDEDILVAKCLGRRVCGKCSKNFNVADLHLPARDGRPAVDMPPLAPPAACAAYMTTRSDDIPEVVQRRLEVYKQEAKPVEDYFREQGILLDFEITGGIPETLPRLISVLQPHNESLEERRQVA